jgi:sialate O-acetylesterase
VAKRLVRWALVKDYGFELECSSPMYKSHEIKADKVTLQFDHIAGGLRVYDFKTVTGFTIAGADQKFVPAQAKIMGDKIQVCSDQVKVPVAVRYAWAGNPECNIYSKIDLPLTPFRTDNWKLGSQID